MVWLAIATSVYGAFLALSAPAGILDARLGYSREAIFELMRHLGNDGREAYLFSSIVDLGFIVVYGTLLRTWFRFLSVRGALPGELPPRWAALPIVFDLVETTSVLVMLYRWPDVASVWMVLAIATTPLKWAAIAAAVVLIGWGELRLRKASVRRTR